MKKIIILVASVMVLGLLFGCDNNNDKIVVTDYGTPQRPQNVFSITGDGQVRLFWLPVEYDNLQFYRIWRNTDGGDQYYLYDTVLSYFDISVYEDYTDYNVTNGQTYWYAVTAYGMDGEESELSYELVYDTPRPEGTGLVLTDTATVAATSGFDLSTRNILLWNNAETDIFVDYDAGLETYFLNAARSDVYIQDMGFTQDLDEISFAPDTGWSYVGWQEIIEGHTFVIWADHHYAKMRVDYADYNDGWVEFEWAYQIDADNPQLAPPPPPQDINYGKRLLTSENNDQPSAGL